MSLSTSDHCFGLVCLVVVWGFFIIFVWFCSVCCWSGGVFFVLFWGFCVVVFFSQVEVCFLEDTNASASPPPRSFLIHVSSTVGLRRIHGHLLVAAGPCRERFSPRSDDKQ